MLEANIMTPAEDLVCDSADKAAAPAENRAPGEAQEQRCSPAQAVEQAALAAGNRIAPLWPLQHFVAVNPLLGLAQQSLSASGRILARSTGARLTMPRAYYRDAITSGEISDQDLAAALRELQHELPGPLTLEQIHAQANETGTDPAALKLPTVASIAAQLTGTDWEAVIVESISGWAGDYYDRGIAPWTSPLRELEPLPAYLALARSDRSAELLGLREARAAFAALPANPEVMLQELTTTLEVPAAGMENYFHRLLADISGWAGHARYAGWGAELGGDAPRATLPLLAARAAWELVLYRTLDSAELRKAWADCRSQLACEDAREWRTQQAADHVLHLAFERATQRRLAGRLQQSATQTSATAQERATCQAVFCIDVRSERLRRAFEQASPGSETLGFAGFFGLAAARRDAAGDATARCPVLLEPQFTVDETACGSKGEAPGFGATQARGLAARWSQFRRAAVASFGYVEALGLFYAPGLLRAAWGRFTGKGPEPASVSRDSTLHFGLELPQRLDLAEGILRGMSLTDHFAQLVLFVGHGSSSANNPYASGLDCGACGGHAGDMNARLAALLLNDPEVRAGLVTRGIEVPEDTVFIAGLHNTTTDEVELAAGDDLPAEAATRVPELRQQLARAGALVRAERAPTLGVSEAVGGDPFARRATDWSEVRPEWGLAGCAAFIAAPRSRTRAAGLDGRSFLHSYDWRDDADFQVLEVIMTAPLVVASWITLQYFASSVDNRHFGSGDKTLHNVVGGLGVLEGAGGDLRTGLPWQSVHNGRSLVHEPVRLTAIIEAPRDALNDIIDRHEPLRQLIDNEWIQLHAMDGQGQLWRRADAGKAWIPVEV